MGAAVHEHRLSGDEVAVDEEEHRPDDVFVPAVPLERDRVGKALQVRLILSRRREKKRLALEARERYNVS